MSSKIHIGFTIFLASDVEIELPVNRFQLDHLSQKCMNADTGWREGTGPEHSSPTCKRSRANDRGRNSVMGKRIDQ